MGALMLTCLRHWIFVGASDAMFSSCTTLSSTVDRKLELANHFPRIDLVRMPTNDCGLWYAAFSRDAEAAVVTAKTEKQIAKTAIAALCVRRPLEIDRSGHSTTDRRA
jgi:hypothetical protein